MDEIIAIQKRGAEARAHGFTALDNPFLRATALPAATGESVETWLRKHDAWELGFRIEDVICA